MLFHFQREGLGKTFRREEHVLPTGHWHTLHSIPAFPFWEMRLHFSYFRSRQ